MEATMKHTLIIKGFNVLLSIKEQIKCTKNKVEILQIILCSKQNKTGKE